MKVEVHIGPTCTGKTRTCHDAADYHGGGLYCPLMDQGKIWFDGYDMEKSILLDEFTGDHVSISLLLRLLDIYPMRVSSKGGSKIPAWECVYITSNLHIHEWWNGQMHYEHMNALRRRITRVEYYG